MTIIRRQLAAALVCFALGQSASSQDLGDFLNDQNPGAFEQSNKPRFPRGLPAQECSDIMTITNHFETRVQAGEFADRDSLRAALESTLEDMQWEGVVTEGYANYLRPFLLAYVIKAEDDNPLHSLLSTFLPSVWDDNQRTKGRGYTIGFGEPRNRAHIPMPIAKGRYLSCLGYN